MLRWLRPNCSLTTLPALGFILGWMRAMMCGIFSLDMGPIF
jgi:hypothetical protein